MQQHAPNVRACCCMPQQHQLQGTLSKPASSLDVTETVTLYPITNRQCHIRAKTSRTPITP